MKLDEFEDLLSVARFDTKMNGRAQISLSNDELNFVSLLPMLAWANKTHIDLISRAHLGDVELCDRDEYIQNFSVLKELSKEVFGDE